MSLNQATRTPLKLRSRLPVKREPGSVIEMGQRGSGPAITLSSSATSGTLRAMGRKPRWWTRRLHRRRAPRGRGGAESNHAAKRRWIAQGTAAIAAIGDRNHAACQAHGRAAAAAAAGLRQIVRVFRRAEHFVEGLRSRAEFRRVGFADADGAGLLDPLHENRIVLRHVVLEDSRSESGADARGFHQVLVRDGQPVQRSKRRAASLRFVGFAGILDGLLRHQRDDRIHLAD